MSILPAIREPKIRLHPYQAKLVDELRTAYRDDEAPCLVLPTGGGKTVICAGLAASSQDRNRRVWFGAHRDFLIEQTSATFREMGVEHGILAAGYPTVWKPTMVCSIDTLRSRLSKLGPIRPDVFCWDECHHSPSASWRAVWDWCGPECFHMGLTATPVRLDGRGLGATEPGAPGFTRLILGPTTADLMAMRFLSQYRAFAPTKVDTKGIGKVGGDYNRKQLRQAVMSQVITGDIIGHYRRLADGKRMIYFCVSIDYSQELARAFCEAGIPAEHLDAESSTIERVAAARRFATGKTKVLCNVGLFTEGYDLAAQAGHPVTVEGVGLVRPTMSESLAIQQMGRCLRRKDTPAIIIDHAGVIEMHGLPDTDRDWSLQGREKRATGPKVKTCPSCYAVLPGHTRECPHCGHSFATTRAGREVTAVEGQLVEIDPVEFNRRRRSWSQVVGRCTTYEDFVEAAKYLGYKPGWAHFAYREFREAGFVRRRGRL